MQPRQLAIKILRRIEKTDAYVDIIIDNELQKSKLSRNEKGFVNELVNGTLRWRGKLKWLIVQFYDGKYKKCPSNIKYILEVTLYQLLHLYNIPDYAAINEGVLLAKKLNGNYWARKVNGILRSIIREKQQLAYPDINYNAAEFIAVKYSHPQWLVERWINRYGVEDTQKLCEANNQTPEISLRVNRITISTQKLQNILLKEKIEVRQPGYLSEFLKVKKLPNLSKYKPFQQGLFSIQDESAGLVAHLVDPKPGELIVDLCAAPGGKTTHIAELAANKCYILANDLYFNRLLLIRQNIKRLGLQNINLLNADAAKYLNVKADKVLVDAPCSGFGVLSKRSDLRWKRTSLQVEQVIKVQLQVIAAAALLVKRGGTLVYSTCTIEPDENENIINNFLIKNPNFIIDNPVNYVSKKLISNGKYIYTYPHIHNMDGSFAVRLIKRND